MKNYPLVNFTSILIGIALFAWAAISFWAAGQIILAAIPGIALGLGVLAFVNRVYRSGLSAALDVFGRVGLQITAFAIVAILILAVVDTILTPSIGEIIETYLRLVIIFESAYLLYQLHRHTRIEATTSHMPERFRVQHHAGIWVLAIVFIPFALYTSYNFSDMVNPDGLAYMQIARQFAAGELVVRAYWAPLYSLLMVPFLWLGVDVVVAAHLVSALAVLVAAIVLYYFAQVCGVSRNLSLLAAISFIPFLAPGAFALITPDSLSVTFVVLYLYLCIVAVRSQHPILWMILCGIVAGLGYLTRSYFLPFFVVHFTLYVWLLIAFKQQSLRVIFGWIAALFAFGLIVAPWIIGISHRTGSFTIGTASAGNRSMVAPQHPYDAVGGPTAGINCWRTYPCTQPEDVLFPWEDHDPNEIFTWSVFENVDHVIHQINITNDNLLRIISKRSDFALILLLLLTLATIVKLRDGNTNSQLLFILSFLVLSAFVYISGYTVTYSVPNRYFWPIIPLAILVLYMIFDKFQANMVKSAKMRVTKQRMLLMLAVMVISLGVVQDRDTWLALLLIEPRTCFRNEVKQFDRILQEPFVGDIDNVQYISFFLFMRSYGAVNRDIFDVQEASNLITQTGAVHFITSPERSTEYVSNHSFEYIDEVTICDEDYVILRVPHQ